MGDAQYMLGRSVQVCGLKKNTAKARALFSGSETGQPKRPVYDSVYVPRRGRAPGREIGAAKAFIWGMVSKINGYPDADSILEFNKMQLSNSVQAKATELARSCFDSGYTS